MTPLHRISLYVWLTLKHMRPISLGRLIMPCVFISCWMILRALDAPQAVAFVWAGVLAQATQVWSVLPVTIKRQRQTFGRARTSVRVAVTLFIALLAFQIWWSDPWMTQRIVTVYCAVYALIMALGIWGDKDVLNRFAYAPPDANVSLEFRRHLLKLYAFVALIVLVVNEVLMAFDAPLSTTVATFALLPIALHYVYFISLQLTAPALDKSET